MGISYQILENQTGWDCSGWGPECQGFGGVEDVAILGVMEYQMERLRT